MSFVPKFGIGQSVLRTEDPRLSRGEGRHTDDSAPAGALVARLLRSDHAHGVIRRLDVAEAGALPGVRLEETTPDAVFPDMDSGMRGELSDILPCSPEGSTQRRAPSHEG